MNIKAKKWYTADERPKEGELVLLFLADGRIWPSCYSDIDGGTLYVKMGCGWTTEWDEEDISRWALLSDCRWEDT